MSFVSVKRLKYSKYNFSNDVISHTGGGDMGYGRKVDIVVKGSDDNNLYGNGVIIAAARKFLSGDITLETSDLSQAVTKDLNGIKESALETISGITDTGVKELIYDDDADTPYLTIGIIIEGNEDSSENPDQTPYYRAVVLTKVMFNLPDTAAETQEKEIKWQTPTITGAIMRDDSAKHAWKRECTFTTEAQAEAYIDNRLGLSSSSDTQGGTHENN